MPNLAASSLLLSIVALAPSSADMPPGETPPPGAPWLLTYRQACRDALLHGRPVMVYFTKTY